jgi:hypothetical protein
MEGKKTLSATKKISGFLLAMIPLFGVIVPTIGFFYYFGHLSAFGLDTNAFPASLWDLWIYSFYASYELVLWSLKFMFLFGLVTVGLIVACIYFPILSRFVITLDKKGWIPKFLKTEIKFPAAENEFASCISCWLYTILKYLIATLMVLLLVFGVFYVLVKFGVLGEAKGKESIAKYQTSGCAGKTWSGCVSYTNPDNANDKSYSGLLVAASSSHIAIFDGGSVSVITRKPEYVLVRAYTPKKKEKVEKEK